MNTHELDFSIATDIDREEVRRKAEAMRAEQAVRIFQGLGRLISTGYAKLASYGAVIHKSYRTPMAFE
ncbi:MAG: hypothetical protein HQ514_04655 [Rhodospirillales bacterium]|nr:hypothetical protein [Rhodospirillales bacterium]